MILCVSRYREIGINVLLTSIVVSLVKQLKVAVHKDGIRHRVQLVLRKKNGEEGRKLAATKRLSACRGI